MIIRVHDYYKPYIGHRQNAQNIRTNAPNRIMLLLFTYCWRLCVICKRRTISAKLFMAVILAFPTLCYLVILKLWVTLFNCYNTHTFEVKMVLQNSRMNHEFL